MPLNRPLSATLAALGMLGAGLVLSTPPALAAPPEEPVTKAATAITGTTATLNGELNPNVTAKTGYDFTYNTNGECTGATTTTQGAEATGTKMEVSTPLTGLIPSTEYTFCVLATHLVGEVTESTPGLPLKFMTLGLKPVVGIESSSGETPFAAELKAEVNPENQPTTSCEFQYGETIVYGKTATCEPETLEGPTPVSTSAHLLGLEKNTTYHYHVVVKNATGETKGTDKEVKTLIAEKPVVGSESISGLTSTGATVHAQVNPNYQETTYAFKYALNEALTEGAVTVAGASPLAGEFAELPVSVNTGVLQPRTTYFYRAEATNKTGTTEAATVEHFTTLATPAVTTGEATNLTRTSAMLSGTVNPAGAATTDHFAYIDQAGYEAALGESAANRYANGRITSESSGVGSDYTVHAVGPTFAGELHPGVTYHYALVAINSVGTTIGPDATFTASAPTPPIAVTGEAVNVSPIPAQAAVTPVQLIAWPPFVAAALAAAEPHESTSTGGSKPLTKAQKLAKALAACNRKPKKRRPTCRRQAKKRYR